MAGWNTSFLWGPAYFQGRAVSFRKGNIILWPFSEIARGRKYFRSNSLSRNVWWTNVTSSGVSHAGFYNLVWGGLGRGEPQTMPKYVQQSFTVHSAQNGMACNKQISTSRMVFFIRCKSCSRCVQQPLVSNPPGKTDDRVTPGKPQTLSTQVRWPSSFRSQNTMIGTNLPIPAVQVFKQLQAMHPSSFCCGKMLPDFSSAFCRWVG